MIFVIFLAKCENLILNIVDFYWTILFELAKRWNSLNKRNFEIFLHFEENNTFIYNKRKISFNLYELIIRYIWKIYMLKIIFNFISSNIF